MSRNLIPIKVQAFHFCKRRPVSNEPVPTVSIFVDRELPDLTMASHWQNVAAGWFNTQAVALETALWYALPQGTYDRLVAAMLTRAASLYHLSGGDIQERDNDEIPV